MNFLKNVSKKNMFLVGGSILLLIIIIGLLVTYNNNQKENNNQDNNYQENKKYKEEKYTMYLKINPLVKFEFSEGYYVCGDGFSESVCSDKTSKVNNLVLVNDDAKEMYKDLKIEGLTLVDALVSIYDLSKEKNIEFDTFEIVSNYQFDTENLENEIINKIEDNESLNIISNYSIVLDEEKIIDNLEKDIYYSVTFNSDGGSVTPSIKVKDGFTITEPKSPEKDGYTFVEWQLDGKKYDFSNVVTKDIKLVAKWKKEVKTETTDKNDTNSKVEDTEKENNNKVEDNKNDSSTNNSNNNSNSSANNNSTTESNEDKIKLSDNIKVTVGNEYVEKDCYFVIYADNFQSVFTDAKISNASGYGSVSYWAGPKSDSAPGEVSEEELKEKWDSLTFNTSKENKLLSLLKKYSTGKHAGIKNLKYSVDNHRITFTYDYLDFDKTSAHKEIQKALNGSIKFNGTCGGGMSSQETLTKELCNEYNLSCE